MELRRTFFHGFRTRTAPATVRALCRMARHCATAAGESVRGMAFDQTFRHRLWRQLGRTWRLALTELTITGRRCAGFLLPPKRWHFPLALFSYLFVVFALEVVFLKTFLPDETPVRLNLGPVLTASPRQGAFPAQEFDPDQVDEFRALADTFLPAMHPRAPLASQFLVRNDGMSPTEGAAAAPLLVGGEDEMLLLADAHRHPLLCVPTRPLPEPGPEAFDSVRKSVARSEVRMPVDKLAFHPLDKEAFLAAASSPERLRAVFACVPMGLPVRASLLAELPPSAIAPPLTRLDRIRMADARRQSLGTLSAHFESGIRGVFAIGYDTKGGTSYGKYQLSSRMGAIRNFIKYLDKRAPSWAHRLRAAGLADTGGTQGIMPREWTHIAAEHPVLFEKLQDDFIHSHYYSPTIQAVREQTGLDIDTQSTVIREVLWSTAVHHGPTGGANIFITASARAKKLGGDFGKTLLEEVYRERERRLDKGSITQRSALKARLEQEMTMALARMEKGVAPKQAQVASAAGGLM